MTLDAMQKGPNALETIDDGAGNMIHAIFPRHWIKLTDFSTLVPGFLVGN